MQVHETWGFSAPQDAADCRIERAVYRRQRHGQDAGCRSAGRQLNLDLYRIDLSAVVSKYIGETEKNLKQVFDAAETGGLCCCSTRPTPSLASVREVKDSHDRYANIEVGYLLQRMEAFQGLAILTTNVKSALDKLSSAGCASS